MKLGVQQHLHRTRSKLLKVRRQSNGRKGGSERHRRNPRRKRKERGGEGKPAQVDPGRHHQSLHHPAEPDHPPPSHGGRHEGRRPRTRGNSPHRRPRGSKGAQHRLRGYYYGRRYRCNGSQGEAQSKRKSLSQGSSWAERSMEVGRGGRLPRDCIGGLGTRREDIVVTKGSYYTAECQAAGTLDSMEVDS